MGTVVISKAWDSDVAGLLVDLFGTLEKANEIFAPLGAITNQSTGGDEIIMF